MSNKTVAADHVNPDSIVTLTGYIVLGGSRLQVDFQVPQKDLSDVQVKDAAFMAALAQKASITHHCGLVIDGQMAVRSRISYEGDVIQVDLTGPAKSTVADKDAAFLAYLASVVDLNYLELGSESDVAEDGKQVRVAVIAEDSQGAPEIVRYLISCSEEDYEQGYHYELAKNRAREDGYCPKFAFDEFDPAWRSAARLNDDAEMTPEAPAPAP